MGSMDAPEDYRLIIDCLLNLPLLYWASEETGDSGYREIAEKHIHTVVANVIREDREHYRRIARRVMKSLYDNYAVKDSAQSNGLVLHSTYSNHSPYNTCNHYDVDECNSWGDYFYMEALTRMSKDWELYW